MPRISKEEQMRTDSKIDYLEEELEELKPLTPFLEIAKQLKEETQRLINAKYPADGSAPSAESYGYEFEDIGELAYKNILIRSVEQAREELVAKYEQQHRRDLYTRIIGEIESNEGDDIAKGVRTKIETNPDIAKELRASAREELGARAVGIIHTEINAEQQEVVNREAERQLGLDRLDVKFALDGELDLVGDDLMELLEPGDKLELYYDTDKDKRSPMTFKWVKDANNLEGWVFVKAGDSVVVKANSGQWNKIKPMDDTFVTLGVINKDLENGKDVIQPNKLVVGLPLIIVPVKGKPIIPNRSTNLSYGSHYGMQPILVAATDFQTKDLVFTGRTSKKVK